MPSAAEIQAYLSANPGMSDADIAAAMNQYGVSTADMAAATGSNLDDIQSRYDAVAAPVAAPEPVDIPDAAPVYEPPAPIYEPPEPVYTPPSRGGKLELEPADEPIAPPVAPVAPTGIAALAPTTPVETPTGVAALAPTTPPVVVPPAAPVAPAKPTDQEIVKFLTDNPTVSDADIAKIMDSTGLKPEDIARATGAKVEDVTNRYEAATAPAATAPPTTTASPS